MNINFHLRNFTTWVGAEGAQSVSAGKISPIMESCSEHGVIHPLQWVS